jgi:hypothetical protein
VATEMTMTRRKCFPRFKISARLKAIRLDVGLSVASMSTSSNPYPVGTAPVKQECDLKFFLAHYLI